MKLRILTFFSSLVAILALGQGTVVFDQQSSDESRVLEGGIGSPGQDPAQSFTPSLTGVDFVRLWVILGNQGQQLGVNLRANSPSGPILGSSSTVTIPTASFSGALTFSFASQGPVTPGTAYYIQPFPIGGGGFELNQSAYFYTGGTLFSGGVPDPSGHDLWFREGIVVPEPGTTTLFLVAVSFICWRWRKWLAI